MSGNFAAKGRLRMTSSGFWSPKLAQSLKLAGTPSKLSTSGLSGTGKISFLSTRRRTALTANAISRTRESCHTASPSCDGPAHWRKIEGHVEFVAAWGTVE